MRCYLIRKIASVADRDKLANLQRNLLVKHRGNDPGPDRADVGYEDQTDGASYTSALMMGCLAIALALCYGYYSKLKGAAHVAAPVDPIAQLLVPAPDQQSAAAHIRAPHDAQGVPGRARRLCRRRRC